MTQSQLRDSSESLQIRMLYDIKNKFVRNRNKTIDWVVNDFLLVVSISIRLQMFTFNNYLKNNVKE